MHPQVLSLSRCKTFRGPGFVQKNSVLTRKTIGYALGYYVIVRLGSQHSEFAELRTIYNFGREKGAAVTNAFRNMTSTCSPILIIGAGISGLTLAHACKKEDIPFRIFERDEAPTARSSGWGLTLNWALPTFRSLLPEDIVSRLPETYVNQNAVNAGEKGSFTFYDLSTGQAKWKVPASERIRVARERLRMLMLTGLDVEWGKRLKEITYDDDVVNAVFFDGSSAQGSLIVACDGSHSTVRRLLHAQNSENYELPIRLIGVGVQYPENQLTEVRELDPYFFQGSHPRDNVFIFFSFLETLGDPGAPAKDRDGVQKCRCQIMMSWPYREGFFGRADPTDVPNTERGMLVWLKTLSAEWAEPFRSLVQNIPKTSELKPIELTDWVPQRSSELPHSSRVALVGDAAHAMVMYRGEGANHSIVDVSSLLEKIRPLFKTDKNSQISEDEMATALSKYEDEMIERTDIAVLASRQACMDAHDYSRLNDNSPLVRRRLMKADLEDVK